MAYQCDECGKTLASEGGLGVHMESHARPAKVAPAAPLPAVAPPLREDRPASPHGHGKTEPTELMVAGIALVALALFLVSLAAIVHPSLIRNHRRTALAAAGSPRSVPIPDSGSDASPPSTVSPATPAGPGTETAPGTQTAPTTPRAPATTAVPAAGDSEKVKSLALALADYGPGWQVDRSGNDPTAGDQAFSDGMGSCLGDLIGGPDSSVGAPGPDVVKGDLQASSDGTLYPTAKEAAADFAKFNDPRIVTCFQSAFTQGLIAEGLPASGVSVTAQRYSVPAGAVAASGVRMVMNIAGPGGAVTMFLDLIVLQHDRAESSLTLFSLGSRVPSDVEQVLVQRLAQRSLSVESVSA